MSDETKAPELLKVKAHDFRKEKDHEVHTFLCPNCARTSAIPKTGKTYCYWCRTWVQVDPMEQKDAPKDTPKDVPDG